MKFFLFLAAVLFIVGCNNNKIEPFKNQFGSSSRDNNFEHLGNFVFQILTNDRIIDADTCGSNQTPLILNENEIIVAAKNFTINKIISDKSIWKYKLDSVNAASGLVADDKNNIYFIGNDGFLYSISNDGKLNWKKIIAANDSTNIKTYSEPLITDDGIIIGTSYGLLEKFSFSGSIIWKNNYCGSVTKLFSEMKNKDLIIPLTNNQFGGTDSIMLIDKNGNIKKSIKLDNFRILTQPLISENHIIISGAVDIKHERFSIIKCFDENLNQIWSIEIGVMVNEISSDNSGNLYFAGYSSGVGESMTGLFSYDKNGRLIWQTYFKVKIASQIFVSKDFLAFSASAYNGSGIFIVNKVDGRLVKTFQLNDMPLVYLNPAAAVDGSLVFVGSDDFRIVKLTETQLDKILPW
jgi:hypothetical protein